MESMRINGRIETLEAFYSGNEISSQLKNMQLDDQGKGKHMTPEMKGQFVIEQLKKAALTLRIWPFICPYEEEGALEIPILESLEFYIQEETSKDTSTLQDLKELEEMYSERAIMLRERYVTLKNQLSELKTKLFTEKFELYQDQEESEDSDKKGGNRKTTKPQVKKTLLEEQVDGNKDVYLAKLESDIEITYEKYEKANSNAIKQKKEVRDLMERQIQRASIRFNNDNDALVRLQDSYNTFKHFSSALLKKYPQVEETA